MLSRFFNDYLMLLINDEGLISELINDKANRPFVVAVTGVGYWYRSVFLGEHFFLARARASIDTCLRDKAKVVTKQ